MSLVQVEMNQELIEMDESLYIIDWRYCRENQMERLPRERVPDVPENWGSVFQRSGTVSFRAKKDHYHPFWVAWVMCYNGHDASAAQYIAVCKIWGWGIVDDSDDSSAAPNAFVGPWSSQVAPHNTWKLQRKSDSARMSSSSLLLRDIEVVVSVVPTTFLERTVIKMKVEIRDSDGSSNGEMDIEEASVK